MTPLRTNFAGQVGPADYSVDIVVQCVNIQDVARRYLQRTRAESVAETRTRIVAAARRVLAAGGDPSAEAVARRAGVSKQTVYTHFGSNSGLLFAVLDDARRSAHICDFPAVWDGTDSVTALRRFAGSALLAWELFWDIIDFARRRRGGDVTVAPFLDQLDDLRHGYLLAISTQLDLESRLVPGLTAARAADLAMAMTGPGTYEELVRGRGWRLPDATVEVSKSIVASLVDNGAPPAATPVDWAALGVLIDPFADVDGPAAGVTLRG